MFLGYNFRGWWIKPQNDSFVAERMGQQLVGDELSLRNDIRQRTEYMCSKPCQCCVGNSEASHLGISI